MKIDEDVKVLLAGRAAVYRIFQGIFGNEPSSEMLQELGEQSTRELFALFSSVSDDYRRSLSVFEKLVNEYNSRLDTAAEHLCEGFTRLFVGPGQVEADPWESVYLTKGGTLFQSSTLEVRRAYVAAGFIPQQYPHVADDHIALELDFLMRLAEKAMTEYDTKDIVGTQHVLFASKEFLKNHLMRWVSLFASQVATSRYANFYQEAAAVLVAFLPIDYDAIEELETAL